MNVQRHLILAVVTDVNHSTVTYPGCTQCYTKLLIDPTTKRYHCIKCGVNIPGRSVQWRYRLVLTIADHTTICRVVVFGRTLDPFFGKTATDFHRSLTSLDKSGYPAEEFLSNALMKTFHGKYFFFGLKLPPSTIISGTVPTLLDFNANQHTGLTNQSMLNSTDVTDNSHILVYQMIVSNDGVYATVSDFIRLSIKHLRNNTVCEEDRTCTDQQTSGSNNTSWRYNSSCSIAGHDSELYKSGSFNIKQKSLAFSFDSSAETSSECFNTVNNTSECGNSKRGRFTTGVSYNHSSESTRHCKTYLKASDTSDYWKLTKHVSTVKDGQTIGLTKDSLSYMNTAKSPAHDMGSETMSHDVDSVTQKLNFSNISDNGCHFDKSKNIEEEPNNTDIPTSSCMDIRDNKNLVKHGINVSDSRHESEIFKHCDDLEQFIEMPDSEGLDTFLACVDLTKHNKSINGVTTENDSIETDAENWKNATKESDPCLKADSVNESDLNGIYLPDSEELEAFLDSEHEVFEESTPLKETKKVSNDFNEMCIPDSEQLEAFLDSQHEIFVESTPKKDSDDFNEMCLPDSEQLEAFLDPQNEVFNKSTPLKETKKVLDDFNIMCLPESEELDAFLETFDEGLCITDLSYTSSAKYNESTAANSMSHAPINNNASAGAVKFKKERWRNKYISDQVPSFDVHKKSSLTKTSSCNNEQSIQKVCQQSTEFKHDTEKVNSLLCLSDKINRSETSKLCVLTSDYQSHLFIDQRTENSPDSGLHLSTSSLDLFPCLEYTQCHGSQGKSSSVSICAIETGEKVDIVYHIGNPKLEHSSLVDADFEDTWSELFHDELGVSHCESNECSKNSSAKTANKYKVMIDNTNCKENFTEKIPLMSNKKGHLNQCDKSTIHSHKEDLTKQVDYENQTNFDSSDILFDTPESSISQKNSLKPVLSYSVHSSSTQFTVDISACTSGGENQQLDEEVIFESQSSIFESGKSSIHSCDEERSRLGELTKGKKVMFSKKLRRVSSCRLMDIKMKENRNSPLITEIIPNSCLKPCIRTSYKYPETPCNKLPSLETPRNTNTHDGDNCSQVNDSFFIESSQAPSKHVQPDCEIRDGDEAKNISGKEEDIPSTPDLWGTSFEESILNTSDDLNRPIEIDTPDRDDDQAIPNDDFPHLLINDTRLVNKSGICIPIGNSSGFSFQQGLDTPDIFSQFVNTTLSSNSIKKENKRGLTFEHTGISYNRNKLLKNTQRQVFKCIVSNTPSCDKTVMTNSMHAIEKDDNFSPDMFDDDLDCDTEVNMYNIPSVLCKQLFF